MCRLFGAVGDIADASRWLVDDVGSANALSHANRDGAGLGWFQASGQPHLFLTTAPAYRSEAFTRAADALQTDAFVGHVRLASSGDVALRNTHPFTMDGRILAQNGGLVDNVAIDRELGDALRRVHGDTDSERIFALLTRQIERRDGDVPRAVADTSRWLHAHAGVRSLNFVMIEPHGLWAYRDPAERTLGFRSAGVARDAHEAAQLVVASQLPEPGMQWTELAPHELLHATADGRHSVQAL